MEWVKAGNDLWVHLNGGLSVWSLGLERRRTKFLTDLGRFYAGIDHTLLVCAIAVLVLGVVFWFSLKLKGKTDY